MKTYEKLKRFHLFECGNDCSHCVSQDLCNIILKMDNLINCTVSYFFDSIGLDINDVVLNEGDKYD